VTHCPACGLEDITIPRIEQLHRVLATHFINQTRALAPIELRFLRKHIGLSTSDFAVCMGVSRETVSRWETGNKPMGAQADRLVRLLVATSMPITDYAAKDVLMDIDPSKAAPKRPARFGMRASPDGWRPEREPAAA
jgi:DNA-binding transcriptional regulator YiaG